MRLRELIVSCAVLIACSEEAAVALYEDVAAAPDVSGPGFVPGEVAGSHDSGGPTEVTSGGDDVAPPETDAGPVAPENSPPGFQPLDAVTVKMGHSVTVSLAGVLSDVQDEVGALTLSWASYHVGLALEPGWQLRVVGPTVWSGDEVIPLVVTDTGGLTASRELTVTVELVEPPKPVDPPKPPCGLTTFAFDSKGSPAPQTVLVSGTFNAWASNGTTATVLGDPDHDGVFEASVLLVPGSSHQYKFIVDGKWIADPANPLGVDDGFGGKNSVLEVPQCP